MEASFSLPFPPSSNNLFPGKVRRYPSKVYVAWRKAASGMVPKVHIPGPYSIRIIFDRPDRRGRDLGNLEKAPHDFCVSEGVVVDDRYCNRIELAWSDKDPEKPAKCHITVFGES